MKKNYVGVKIKIIKFSLDVVLASSISEINALDNLGYDVFNEWWIGNEEI